MIAKEAGFTRSNIYKYFSSKEEIFLEFLKHDIILWWKDLVKTCRRSKTPSVETFAAMWVMILSRYKRLLDLLSIMHSYLEKNVSEQSLVSFKIRAIDELKVLSDFLCKTFPGLSREKAVEFLELQLASAIGLYQITNLSELQRKVLEYPKFRHLKVNFKRYLQKTVECLLHGLMA